MAIHIPIDFNSIQRLHFSFEYTHHKVHVLKYEEFLVPTSAKEESIELCITIGFSSRSNE